MSSGAHRRRPGKGTVDCPAVVAEEGKGGMREFMKKHHWTPGWLIFGVILVVISAYSSGTWTLLVGLWVGLWAAYPILGKQEEQARKAGWAAGYEAARDKTINWEMESTVHHAFQIWVGQEQGGDWTASVNALPRQGAGATAGPGEGRILGPFDSRDAAIKGGKRYIGGKERQRKLEQEK